MTVYLVDIERRKGDGDTLGPFSTRDKAIAALREYVGDDTPAEDEFGGQLSEGTYYSEEETIEVLEREVA